MKVLFSLLLLPLFSFSQGKGGGYAHAGYSRFASEKFEHSSGVFLGIGVKTGGFTSGVQGDIYTFSDKKTKYAILSADFRAFLDGLEKPVSPFLAAQPGYVLYNKRIGTVSSKGSFAFSFLGGVRVKPQKNIPGLVFGVGYQNIAFKNRIGNTNSIKRYSGVKLNLGISI